MPARLGRKFMGIYGNKPHVAAAATRCGGGPLGDSYRQNSFVQIRILNLRAFVRESLFEYNVFVIPKLTRVIAPFDRNLEHPFQLNLFCFVISSFSFCRMQLMV